MDELAHHADAFEILEHLPEAEVAIHHEEGCEKRKPLRDQPGAAFDLVKVEV